MVAFVWSIHFGINSSMRWDGRGNISRRVERAIVLALIACGAS